MICSLILAAVTQFVDPFVGTTFTGHTYPAACVPFGLVQAGPDTGNYDWHHCSGYRYEETTLRGFSHTHLNGTGVGDLGDVLLLPFTGDQAPDSYEIDKSSEKASPGYYAVKFDRGNLAAEVTASEHSAIYRFTCNADGKLRLLFDGQWALNAWGEPEKRVLAAAIELDDDKCGFSGGRRTKIWVERDLGYAVRFDRPYAAVEKFFRRPGDKAESLAFTFDIPRGEALSVKVGLSASGKSAAAKRNLDLEFSGFDFDRARISAEKRWEEMLGRVEVEGTDDQKKNFYTSLYHLFQQPNNIADVGYRPYYSTFSCWDTFRAAHPLYTILCPERVPDMVDSMLRQGKFTGFLPVWTLWGKDNQCMIATHSIPVIVDWFLKTGKLKLKNEEWWKDAYLQIKDTLTKKHDNRKKEGWDLLEKYGYFPSDMLDRECVSRTMECCYDDYCAALMAEKLGFKEDAEFFRKRSGCWKNVFDPETRLVRPKNSKGEWKKDFDPYELRYGNEYTEGNAYQYTWHVMQDPDGLVSALGGREAALKKLDELFTLKNADEGGKVLDVTGSIGQYVHGNEPSHHIIYFYTLLGERGKTAAKVREVFDRFYLPKPDGLCGNDDCGQMSAWYIFSAAGFYPFNPCGGEYVLGEPQLPKLVFHLPGGKTLTVKHTGGAGTGKSVRMVSHSEIMQGGILDFGDDVRFVPAEVDNGLFAGFDARKPFGIALGEVPPFSFDDGAKLKEVMGISVVTVGVPRENARQIKGLMCTELEMDSVKCRATKVTARSARYNGDDAGIRVKADYEKMKSILREQLGEPVKDVPVAVCGNAGGQRKEAYAEWKESRDGRANGYSLRMISSEDLNMFFFTAESYPVEVSR